MEDISIIKLRKRMDELFYACRNEVDLRCFRGIIVDMILSEDYKSQILQSNLRNYLYITDLNLKNYDVIQVGMENENVELLHFFKLHKYINAKLFLLYCILICAMQLYTLMVHTAGSASQIYTIGLFVIPILLITVTSEYCLIQIAKFFPDLFSDILENELMFNDKDEKYFNLDNFFNVRAFRESRMQYDNLLRNRVKRIIGIILIFVFFGYTFSENIMLAISVSIFVSIIISSVYRHRIGKFTAFQLARVNIKKISLNIYAKDNISGCKNLFRVYGYSFVTYLLQFFLLIVFALFKRNEVMKNYYDTLLQLIISINFVIISTWGITSLTKTIQLFKSLRKQKVEFLSKVLSRLKRNPSDIKASNELTLVNNMQIDPWSNFSKVFKYSVIYIFPIVITILASVYPSEIRKFIDSAWNYFK